MKTKLSAAGLIPSLAGLLPFLFLSCFVLLNSFGAMAQFTKLLDFNGAANGAMPFGDLISDGTFLYGMTYGGGANNQGTIFKIKPNGTGYIKLLDFAGAVNGSNPYYGSLLYDGTYLYGMTQQGGTSSNGTIFKIKPDGTGDTVLLSFSGANGSQPGGSLISDGTFLYGMTYGGGTNSFGTIFKIKPDGTGYTALYNFGNSPDGNYPEGSLSYDGTYLYGMTSQGGTSTACTYGCGTIFKIKPNGTGYSKLLDFTGALNGQNPQGSLISDGTFLYGMTEQGGNGYGTLFKIKPDGSAYSMLLNFASTSTNGRIPYGSLIYDGTFLYGMTEQGGTSSSCAFGCGIVFKIKPDGTGYSNLYDFTGATGGYYPRSSLFSDGTFLYGMTRTGGTSIDGIIFKLQNIYINGKSPICIGDSTTLTASGGTTYSWNTGQTTTSITVAPTTNSTYTVTATTGTFVATATATVAITAAITASAGPNSTICNGANVTLTASGGNIYSWNNGATTSVINVSPTITTTYSVVVSAGSCSDTASASVTVQTCTGINEKINTNEIIISPNPGSGVFQITSDELRFTSLEIYNVYGEKVYSRNSGLVDSGKTNPPIHQSTIDISSQPSGIYFLRITSLSRGGGTEGGGFVVKKIVKE